MPIYRKKPNLVEARQVTSEMLHHTAQWCGGVPCRHSMFYPERIEMHTQTAEPGDWIVKEANGIFNVYTDEAFRLMHEVD